MAIGSPGPGGRSPSDSDAFLLRSGARSGHKREFAFILRSQAESGLTRTRSGSRPPPPPKRPRRSLAAASGSDADAASGSDADAASDSEVSEREDEDAAHAAKSGRKRVRIPGKRSIVNDSLIDSDGDEAHAVKPANALLDSVLASDAEFSGQNEARVVKNGGRGTKRGKRSIVNAVPTDVALLESVISELDAELLVADALPDLAVPGPDASLSALPDSAVSGPDTNPCALPDSAFSEQCTEPPFDVDALTDSVAEPDAKPSVASPDSAISEPDGNHSVAMDALPDSAVLELGAKSSVTDDAGSPISEQVDEPVAAVALLDSVDSKPDALPSVVSNALPDSANSKASIIGDGLPDSAVLEPSVDGDALSDSAIREQDAKLTVDGGALLDSGVSEPVAEHVVTLDDQEEEHVANKASVLVDGQRNVRSPVRTVNSVKGMASPGTLSRRFTRSLLKASIQSPVRASAGEDGSAVETPIVVEEEELKISVDESAKGTVGVEIPVEGYSGSNSESPGVSLSAVGYGEAKKQSGSFTRFACKSSCDDRQIVLALPVCNAKDFVKVDSVPKKAVTRFTRSALKPPVIKQEMSIGEVPTAKQDHKVDNGVVVKPVVRFTRSSIRPPTKPPPQVEESSETESDTSEEEEETKSVRRPSRKTVKNKMELKMSKKIGLTKLPSNVRELLATGLLEGYPVKYKFGNKQDHLEGVIRGNAISCYCPSCNGSKAYSAYGFEVHAGSNKKHPSDYIYLENGKSLHDVLNACTSGPLNMLEAKIQNVIGAAPRKRPSICQKCGESFRTSDTGEHALLCDSCHGVKYRKTRASLSNGTQRTLKSSRTGSLADPSCSTSLSLSSQKKNNFGRITKKDIGLHKLVFMDDILPEGTEVAYYHHGKRLLDGYIKDSGIFCLHCDAVIKPSAFEAHAGRAQRRKPFHNIYTSNGVSLHELSVSLSKGRKLPTGENDDLCNKCNDGGDLLLCDVCPRAFHKGCVGLTEVPKGDWHCPPCQSMHQKEKYVESNDNAIAAGRVAGDDPIEQIIKRCIRIFTPPGTDVGGCTLCRLHDFSKAAFDERTVLICDQCEKEYHVGCLRDHDMCDLKELPEAEWFCCANCSRIHTALQELLLRGQEPLKYSDADIIKKKHEEKGITKDDIDVRWRLLSGKTASDDSKLLLADALSLFREAFDPIVGAATGRDLIPFIVNGEDMGDQDFGGMYCVVLTVNSAVVSAGILRILGCELAELPLVATSRESQGQGYFQSLFACIERLLVSLNIKHFVLPAAEEALSIWTKKFGFTKMAPGQLAEYAKGAHPMIFQGTTMLHKPVAVPGDSSAAD